MQRNRINSQSLSRLSVLLLVLLLSCSLAVAYDTYDDPVTNQTFDNCSGCHGDFNGSANYVSLKDGLTWPTNLHDTHRATMLDSDCNVCHSSGGRSPVLLDSSSGGDGIPAISCTGCHGRLEDAPAGGGDTVGAGAGLRQHHFGAGETICLSCHTDADPANKTVVGEDVLPPYYGSPFYIFAPTDPCNEGPAFNENYAASTIGLDNDGDGLYDTADPDCGAVVAATPGENSGDTLLPLLVTAHDGVAGTMSLSFEAGCAATDTNIEWGPLNMVSSYGYGTQTASECGIGIGGTHLWNYSGVSSDSIFFLVVGNDGTNEGSLGLGELDAERPEDSGGICDRPQAPLVDRCD